MLHLLDATRQGSICTSLRVHWQHRDREIVQNCTEALAFRHLLQRHSTWATHLDLNRHQALSCVTLEPSACHGPLSQSAQHTHGFLSVPLGVKVEPWHAWRIASYATDLCCTSTSRSACLLSKSLLRRSTCAGSCRRVVSFMAAVMIYSVTLWPE